MARRNGGFGGNPFGQGGGGGGTSPPSTRPNGPGPNPNNAFDTAGNNHRPRRNRNRNPNRGNNAGGGGGDNAFNDPNDPANDDSATQDIAFQDADTYKQGATGKLTNAGVNFGAGTNQVPWLNDQIDQWINDYQGQELTTTPNLQWEDFLGQQFGAAPAPGTYPETGSGDIMDTPVHAMGSGKGKKKKRHNTNNNGGGGKDDTPTPGITPSVAPGLPADTLARLTRNWQAASPTERGYDSTAYRAPKRTIAF